MLLHTESDYKPRQLGSTVSSLHCEVVQDVSLPILETILLL